MLTTHLAVEKAVMIFVVFTLFEFLRICVTKFVICQAISYTLSTEKYQLLLLLITAKTSIYLHFLIIHTSSVYSFILFQYSNCIEFFSTVFFSTVVNQNCQLLNPVFTID